MRVVGLTGGIATGKSTVSKILEEAGAIIIDADQIARDVVKKGLPAYREIVKHFGSDVLLPEGELNRGKLGDIVFKNPDKKKLLNRIVHPAVKRITNLKLKQIEKDQPHAVVILDVPLLFESEMHKGLSEVIVVYIPEHLQLKRLIERDKFSQEAALARIRSQMPIEKKKELAAIIIDNTGPVDKTREQTMEVYNTLKKKIKIRR